MLRLRLFFLLLCSISISNLQASPTLFFSPECTQAYKQIVALHLVEGRQIAKDALNKEPQNLMPLFVQDYADCLELMLNGNPQLYTKLKGNKELRLQKIDECNRQNPYYLFVKAAIHLHWAAIHFRFGEQLNAAIHFRKSFNLIKENKKKFAHFPQNDILLGLNTAVAGTIPDEYAWLTSILGMKGDVHRGISMIDRFLGNTSAEAQALKEEALFYQVYLKFYLQKKEVWAWQTVSGSAFSDANNYMWQLVKANIALNYRKGDAAIQTLEQIPLTVKNNFPIFWYEQAQARHMKMDMSAIPLYQNYIRLNVGKWYTKESWQNIALLHYANGQKDLAQEALKKLKAQGNVVVDADKQAQRFALELVWPNVFLYKAQMLTNGGYYTQALTTINKVAPNLNSKDKVEYNFRLGRIYDETAKDNDAIKCYLQAYVLGKNLKEHYAARSALYLGKLYEQAGKSKEAIQWYRNCLALRNHDFQASIDNQAKAGLNRLAAS